MNQKLSEKKRNLVETLAPFKEAKKSTISTLSSIGRRYPLFKWPIFVITVLFIFIYNVFYHTFIQWKLREKLSRGLAFVMTIVLVLTGVDITALAFSESDADSDYYIVTDVSMENTSVKVPLGTRISKLPFPDTIDVTLDYVELIPKEEISAIEEVPAIEKTIDEDSQGETPEETPEDTPEEMPEAEQEEIPEAAQEETPEAAPEETPEVTPEETPEIVPDQTPEIAPEQTPENITEDNESEPIPGEDSLFPVVGMINPVMNTDIASELVELVADASVEQVYPMEVTLPVIWECDDYNRKVSGFYTFRAKLQDEYEKLPLLVSEEIQLPVITVEVSAADALYHQERFDDVIVEVLADPGVFPEDAKVIVKMITDEEAVSDIEKLLEEKENEKSGEEISTKVEKSYSFDISVVSKDGTELEPDSEMGRVDVVFKNVGATEVEKEENKDLSVYHVEDDFSDADAVESEYNPGVDGTSIVADHFSIYTIVVTSGTQKDLILHYYQGPSKADSYFTVYNETQLIKYKNLLNGVVAGTVRESDDIATILVNRDDASPLSGEGITGLGQEEDFFIRDLNLSVKIMDDIKVSSAWTPINRIPENLSFDGGENTIEFESSALSASVLSQASADYGVLIKENLGTVRFVTVKWNGNTKAIDGEGVPVEPYVSVAVRVDGRKAEIGEAITGAEALAISADGVNYITLERTDDLSIYKTLQENLEEGLEYHIYYVYEDENDTISAATISLDNPRVELNYVSVSYNLEYASTYDMEDGELSEDVMAAVRVNRNGDGTYQALEDYEAVVRAISGHEVPTKSKNVSVSVNGVTLTSDYSYSYDTVSKIGTIHIAKEKITGPIVVTVNADSLEDSPVNTITLKTFGGSVSDPAYDNPSASTYTLNVYEDTVLPTAVNPINNTDAIKFAGWYTTPSCTGSAVTTYRYVEGGGSATYYAKWVLKTTGSHNDTIQYLYTGGSMDVRGYNPEIRTTYNYYWYMHTYLVNGSQGNITIPGNVNSDIFTPLGNSGISVALVMTLESNMVNLTYVFKNTGSSDYTGTFKFGDSSDVDIDNDDSAIVRLSEVSSSGTQYVTMTSRGGKEFRFYIQGADFGIDTLTTTWYGGYSSASSNVFNSTENWSFTGDSGMAFSWTISEGIPAGGYVTRTTKMGVGDASTMSNVEATVEAGNGKFSDGTSHKVITSNNSNVTVNSNGTISAYNKNNITTTLQPPTRSGYKFSYWSAGSEGGTNCAGKTFKENVTLYANWVPQPDKSVTNNSSVQKVSGDTSLLVPETIGSIIINNTTPGATDAVIKQGKKVNEAAGYASGFSGILELIGADDRYLLPDDVEVKITEANGNEIILTRNTGYTYEIWNNRRKASLEVHKQYITGDITITAVGYELPPVTATTINVTVPVTTVKHGERATFTASAVTSKNHIATYQWYIAPYFTNTIDNVVYWTYQNQDGEPLHNGTYDGELWASNSAPITISGANKATLRIEGLDVNPFTGSPNEFGLHKGGYHVYCIVTSVRNITGQRAEAISQTVELEVATAKYEAPSGIEGSATTYYGSGDGTILIERQTRSEMLFKKNTDSNWRTVTEAELAAGKIDNLAAGTYLFKYKSDANHLESAETSVRVDNGKYIVVTYYAQGADNASEVTQTKHVAYGSNVSATTAGLDGSDRTIVTPQRTGFVFSRWDVDPINNIHENTTVNAVYNCAVYTLTLDGCGATTQGTAAIYEKYSLGFFSNSTCVDAVSGSGGITVPTKTGYTFLGYYTQAEGGEQVICQDGCLSENITNTTYLESGTLYAHWKRNPISMSVRNSVYDPNEAVPVTGVSMLVTNHDTSEADNGAAGYDPDTAYDITITNSSRVVANTIMIFADGEYVKSIHNAVFNSSKKYTFEFTPGEVGGSEILFVAAYVEPETAGGTPKEEEELEEETLEQLEVITYSITYKDVYLTGTDSVFTGTFTEPAKEGGIFGVTTVLPGAVKTGYYFAGWFQTPRGTGRSITEITEDNTEDVVVYAKWRANKYDITLVPNEGIYKEGYVLPSQYEHGGDNVALPDNTEITRDNYRFVGWFDNEAFAGNPVTSVDASRVGNATYYAKWEILPQYTITLTPDGADGKIYTLSSCEGYSTNVYRGKDYKFTLETASAYGVKAVKADGKVLTGNDGVYTIENVIDNMTVTVNYESLVSTQEMQDAVATILLADGTTGYFQTIEAAVRYAIKYGSNSVVVLQKEIEDFDITVGAGRAFSIDLNGHSIGESAHILVDGGGSLTLMNSGAAIESEITVDNNGTFNNRVTVDYLNNFGVATNDGTVTNMLQQDSEYFEVSRFVNNGSVASADLQNGYFVENVLDSAPEGLTGYHTIMNDNEYYVDFVDAVNIAGQSTEDATILILDTVDNSGNTITISNQNGAKITVDLNGENFANGSLSLEGNVEFINSRGSRTQISEITASITTTGNLELGAYVKATSALVNNGNLTIKENATVSGDITNNATASLTNNGSITGRMYNYGNVTNNSVAKNVEQYSGRFDNNKTVETTMKLHGGSYTYYAEKGTSPRVPTGVVAKVIESENPLVETYYGTFKDAVDDANKQDPDEGISPFTITVLEDIPDLGGDPVVIDSEVPVIIEPDGHEIGSEEGDTLVIGGDSKPVTIDNPGTIKTPIVIEEEAVFVVEPVPEGETGPGTVLTGDIENHGEFTNGGEVEGDIDNDGVFINEGTVEGTLTNEGEVTNNGELDSVEQKDGTLINGENGTIEELTQEGGQTENNGTIMDAEVRGGGYIGDASVLEGQVATILVGTETIYFGSLDSALEYAAASAEDLVVKLIDDIDGEAADLSTAGKAIIDLNGHSINSTSTVTVEEGATLEITGSGSFAGGITNKGVLNVKTGTTVAAAITNNGTVNNEGTITGIVTNKENVINNGVMTTVNQTSGTFDNKGSVSTLMQLNGGTYMYYEQVGSSPAIPMGAVAKNVVSTNPDVICYFGTIKDAVDEANNNEFTDPSKPYVIEVLEDVNDLGATPVTIDAEGPVVIELNDHTLGDGDEIVVVGGELTIEGPGTVGTDVEVTEDGVLGIDENTVVDGDIVNEGTVNNEGTINGDVTNEGQFENEGTITSTVTNEGDLNNNGDMNNVVGNNGTITNSEGSTIENLVQNGGITENNGSIDSAQVKGGQYSGDEENVDYDGAKVMVETVDEDGNVTRKYYETVDEAIDDSEGNITIVLLDDIEDEDIVVDKPGVVIDLNGHNIDEDSTITVEPGTKETVITGDGTIEGTIDNGGKLTIDEEVTASEVDNSGSLDNKGNIDSLDNSGEAVNEGTVSEVSQTGGKFENDGTVTEFELDGGSYSGDSPSNPIEGGVARIDDTLYGDFESAVEDAKKSTEDVEITLLENIELPDDSSLEIGNDNGKEVAIDLNGNDITGGDIVIESDVNVHDTQGTGTVESDIVVSEDGKLDIASGTDISGDVENNGEVDNKGIIEGNVTNNAEGQFVNNGEIDGNVENNGALENNKDIIGNVTNEESGEFVNKGTESFVGGDVTNNGDLDNEGMLGGNLVNNGDCDNSGNIDGDVTNGGEGSLDNSGSITGQLENKDNAETKNTGDINQIRQTGGNVENEEGGTIVQLRQTGGTASNEGTVENADIGSLSGFEGNLPENGLPGANFSVESEDENGNIVTKYYTTLEEAIEAAENTEGGGTVIPEITPVNITGDVTIPEGVVLEIPEGTSLNIPEGSTLTVEGGIDNAGEIENRGNITNTETGKVENSGDISNKGDGGFVNEGSLDNTGGTLNGDEDSTGTIVNNGSVSGGTINGPFENGEDGVLSKPEKVSGEISNEGRIEFSPSTDKSDAEIENAPGAEVVTIYPPAPWYPEEEPEEEALVEKIIEETQTREAEPETDSEPEEENEEETGADILALNGITIEEAQNLINSDTPEAKEQVSILIEQAVSEGNATVEGYSSFTQEEFAAVLEQVLLPEEKLMVLSGENVTIRTAIVDAETKDGHEALISKVSQQMPDNLKVVASVGVDVFKKVGNNEETSVTNTTIRVTFEVPEDKKPADGKPVKYTVLKAYSDEEGNYVTEEVEIEQDGFFITMDADPTCEYIILMDEESALGMIDFGEMQDETSEETEGTENTGKKREHAPWPVLPAEVAVFGLAAFLLKKKDKKVKNAFAIAALAALVGTTVWLIAYESQKTQAAGENFEISQTKVIVSEEVSKSYEADFEPESVSEYVQPVAEEPAEVIAEAQEAITAKEAAVEEETPAVEETPAAEEAPVEEEIPAEEAETVTVEVKRGMNSRQIANLLEEEGLVDDAAEFDRYLCDNGYDNRLRSNTFEMVPGTDFEGLANILTGNR